MAIDLTKIRDLRIPPLIRGIGSRTHLDNNMPGRKTQRGQSENSRKNLREKGGRGSGYNARKKAHGYIGLLYTRQRITNENFKHLGRSKFPGFFTATIPSSKCTSYKEAYRLVFNDVILHLRKEYGLQAYVAVPERQKETRYIHVHIIVDCFIEMRDGVLQQWYNNLLERKGLAGEYFDKNGRHGDASLNIKAVKDEQKFKLYVLKYITKSMKKNEEDEEQSDEKEGAYYWVSSQLKKMKDPVICLNYESIRMIKEGLWRGELKGKYLVGNNEGKIRRVNVMDGIGHSDFIMGLEIYSKERSIKEYLSIENRKTFEEWKWILVDLDWEASHELYAEEMKKAEDKQRLMSNNWEYESKTETEEYLEAVAKDLIKKGYTCAYKGLRGSTANRRMVYMTQIVLQRILAEGREDEITVDSVSQLDLWESLN